MIPNDHGAKPRPQDGYPFVHSYMADNDLATGRILHFLSRTPYWKNMLVIITEDDPQGGVDHIDAHRSILMMAGPYVKKNYVSKTHANLAFNAKAENTRQYQARLQQEVLTAAEKIERITGENSIHYFAYPYGNTSQELMVLLEQHNYQLGFTVERGSASTFSDRYLINRTMIYGGDSLSKFVRALNTFERVDLK